MKFIKQSIGTTKEQFLAMLKDNDATNKNVKFECKRGNPFMHVSEKSDKIKIKCEYIGGATKDNAFIEGTAFNGTLKEKNGDLYLSGVILTAPIFHTVLLLAFAAFLIMCIVNGAFTPIPFVLIIFDLFMYKDEFEKQGLIERYIKRAARRSEGGASHSKTE